MCVFSVKYYQRESEFNVFNVLYNLYCHHYGDSYVGKTQRKVKL